MQMMQSKRAIEATVAVQDFELTSQMTRGCIVRRPNCKTPTVAVKRRRIAPLRRRMSRGGLKSTAARRYITRTLTAASLESPSTALRRRLSPAMPRRPQTIRRHHQNTSLKCPPPPTRPHSCKACVLSGGSPKLHMEIQG